MKLEFSLQVFEKYSHIKLHENPLSGSRGAPCGRMDRHDKANSRFSNFADAPQTCYQPHEHRQSDVTFSELEIIVNNPGNLVQPNNPGAPGSLLEPHPMCAVY